MFAFSEITVRVRVSSDDHDNEERFTGHVAFN